MLVVPSRLNQVIATRSLASKGIDLDSQAFLVQAVLVAGEADQVLGHGTPEVSRKWDVVQVLVELGANPDGIGAGSQKPLTVARNLVHTAGRTQAIAALIEGGASASAADFTELVREWIDGDNSMEQVVMQMVKRRGAEVVDLPVGYAEETVLDIAMTKLSKPIVQAVFTTVIEVVRAGGELARPLLCSLLTVLIRCCDAHNESRKTVCSSGSRVDRNRSACHRSR